MATYTVVHAAHKTLSGTTVDTVTLSGGDYSPTFEISNRSGATTIYFTTDGTAPTAGGDDTDFVAPGESVIVQAKTRSVKLIGNGNDYSVAVIDE